MCFGYSREQSQCFLAGQFKHVFWVLKRTVSMFSSRSILTYVMGTQANSLNNFYPVSILTCVLGTQQISLIEREFF